MVLKRSPKIGVYGGRKTDCRSRPVTAYHWYTYPSGLHGVFTIGVFVGVGDLLVLSAYLRGRRSEETFREDSTQSVSESHPRVVLTRGQWVSPSGE